MSDETVMPSYMRGLQMHFAHDVSGYPCFYIHGMSGDQKRDAKALASHVRLFTAAPDLLASLREVLGWYVEGGHAVPRIYIDRANAAIAKVEDR